MKVPKSCFRLIDENSIEIVRSWRNQPRIKKNMLSTNEITKSGQLSWFEDLQGDRSRRYFVYFQNARPTGMLYFTDIDQDSCSWGCYIGEEAVWPGSGLLLEVAALDYAFSYLNLNRLNAEVFDFNIPAQKLHKLFEYSFNGVSFESYHRDGGEHHLLKYFYLKQDWLVRRDLVVAKLPRQIIEAVKAITF